MGVYPRAVLNLTHNERRSDHRVGHRRQVLSWHVPEKSAKLGSAGLPRSNVDVIAYDVLPGRGRMRASVIIKQNDDVFTLVVIDL